MGRRVCIKTSCLLRGKLLYTLKPYTALTFNLQILYGFTTPSPRPRTPAEGCVE
jgi:hypothetical protein